MLVHDEVRDALADGPRRWSRSRARSSATACRGPTTRGWRASSSRPCATAAPSRRRSRSSTAQARIGLDDAALDRLANDEDVVKVSVRELAAVAARGGVGATTVASTAHLAALAGITRLRHRRARRRAPRRAATPSTSRPT